MRIYCVIVFLLFLCSPSFAASEKLLEDCRYWRLAKDDAEKAARVAACDRIIADKSTARADLAEAYAVRANRAESEDRRSDAIADYDRALAIDPGQRDWRRSRAYQLHFSAAHDRAIEDFDILLAGKPDAHVMFYRGLSYLSKKDEDRGFSDLDAAIALEPGNAWNNYWRAKELAKRDRTAEALSSVDKAIALKSDDEDYYILRADLKNTQGDPQAAIADLTRSLQINPDYWPPRGNRALLYEQTGQYQLALADYDNLLKVQPESAYYTQRRAVVTAKLAGVPVPPVPPSRAAPPAPAGEAKSPEPAVENRETDCRYYLAVSNTTISVPCPD